MTTNDRLQALLKAIEAKFGRGDSSKWINRDFMNLSMEINKKTKTTISALTLKRLFGKIKTDADYIPQTATIRALELYVDFPIDNKTTASPIIEENKIPETILESNLNTPTKFKKVSIWLVLVFILGFSTAAYFLFLGMNSEKEGLHGSIKILRSEGFNPKTVFFEYSTPNNTDSFKILFDPSFPAIEVDNGTHKTSYIYQYPGMFKVRMMKNDLVVSDKVPVLVETKGWQSLGSYFEQKYDDRYFPITIKKNLEKGYFHTTPDDLLAAGIDTTKIVVVRLDNFHPTRNTGDNFSLETDIKNDDHWSGTMCNSVYIQVIGRTGTVLFRFAKPGCSYWIWCRLSEKTMMGSKDDLSNFAFDLTEWQNIKIINKNKKVAVLINNKKQYEDSYTNSIGELVGTSIIFHGNGTVKNFSLNNSAGEPLFKL